LSNPFVSGSLAAWLMLQDETTRAINQTIFFNDFENIKTNSIQLNPIQLQANQLN